MKVLIYITDISRHNGGPSHSVPLLVRGLVAEGVDVTLMTQRTADMNLSLLEGVDVRLRLLDRFPSRSELIGYLLTEHFDLIHAQSLWDWRYHQLKRAADTLGIAYINTPRGMLEPWSLAQKRWKKKLALWFYQLHDLNSASCLLATADMEAQHVRQLGITLPIAVIPNGIDTSVMPCRSSLSHQQGHRLLFLSRIHPKKGIELLIEAWRQLSPKHPNWQLLIVGDGEPAYVQRLRRLIAESQLQITLSDPLYGDDKYRAYCQSDLFCLPSYSENFGMVIAEAMSCGLPVVTTTNCPWQELNNAHAGWCIPLSVEGLTQCLDDAMSLSDDERFSIGQRASQLVRQRYDYHSVAHSVMQLYQWIIEGNGDVPSFVRLGSQSVCS